MAPHNYKYKSKYAQIARQHFSEGKSMLSLGAKIPVAQSTLYKWLDDLEEFKLAVEEGFALYAEKLEIRLACKVDGTEEEKLGAKGETNALIYTLNTRYKKEYSTRTEVKHEGKIKLEEILELSKD